MKHSGIALWGLANPDNVPTGLHVLHVTLVGVDEKCVLTADGVTVTGPSLPIHPPTYLLTLTMHREYGAPNVTDLIPRTECLLCYETHKFITKP